MLDACPEVFIELYYFTGLMEWSRAEVFRGIRKESQYKRGVLVK